MSSRHFLIALSLAILTALQSTAQAQRIAQYKDRIEVYIDSHLAPTNDQVLLESNPSGVAELTINRQVWTFTDPPSFHFVDHGGSNMIRVQGDFDAGSMNMALSGENHIQFEDYTTTGDVDISDTEGGTTNEINFLESTTGRVNIDFTYATASFFVTNSILGSTRVECGTSLDMEIYDSSVERIVVYSVTASDATIKLENVVSDYVLFFDTRENTHVDIDVLVCGRFIYYSNYNTAVANIDVADSLFETSLFVRTGNEPDQVAISNSICLGEFTVETKGDADIVNLEGIQTDYLHIHTGDDADRISLSYLESDESSEILLGEGNDSIRADHLQFNHDLLIEASSGNDTVLCTGVIDIGVDLLINTGEGDDTVDMVETKVGQNTTIDTEAGFDTLLWNAGLSQGVFQVNLGDDSDFLVLENSDFQDSVIVDGGPGRRDIANGQDNSFSSTLTVSDIESGNL